MAALPPRFAAYLAGLRDNHDAPRMPHYPGLRALPWHDPREVPLARALERRADAIVAEAQRLPAGAFRRESEPIARRGDWDVAFLYDRGRRNDEHCRAAPVTAALIDEHRTVRSLAGLVYFSRLAPGARVALHRGPTNVRLRCHLGIDIPPRCGIAVGGEERTWERGRTLVFDDAFPHEAWNASDRARTVLVVDVWHPDLSADEIALLAGLHRYAAAHARQLAAYWKDNDRAGVDEGG